MSYYYPKASRRRAKRLFFLIIVLILIAGAAATVQLLRPYPALEVRQTSSYIILPGEFTVTFPEQGQAAVGTDKFGVIAASPDQSPVPIASVAKIMTALLVLEAYPLDVGETGPSVAITAEDIKEYQEALAGGQSVLKVTLGTVLTERQMLEGLLLPSGNNIANKLARWVAGSEEAFVQLMNEKALDLGMTSTYYAEPSGIDPYTVSCAVDQIKLAQVAMQNPTFRDIVAMPQTTLPVAGTVYNVNNMLGKNGVVGIKTGSTTKAGGNFVSASPLRGDSEPQYLIAVVLAQRSYRSLQAAIDENVKILNQVRSHFKMYPVIEAGTSYGEIRSAWSGDSGLRAGRELQVFGYPGMFVPYAIKTVNTALPVSPSAAAAVLEVKTGQETKSVQLFSSREIKEPDLLWRLLRFK